MKKVVRTFNFKLYPDGELWRYELHTNRYQGNVLLTSELLSEGASSDVRGLLEQGRAELAKHAERLEEV